MWRKIQWDFITLSLRGKILLVILLDHFFKWPWLSELLSTTHNCAYILLWHPCFMLLYFHSPTKQMYPWLERYDPLDPSMLWSTYQRLDTSLQQDSTKTLGCTYQVLISLAPPVTGHITVWIQTIWSDSNLNNYLLTCSPFFPYAIPRP